MKKIETNNESKTNPIYCHYFEDVKSIQIAHKMFYLFIPYSLLGFRSVLSRQLAYAPALSVWPIFRSGGCVCVFASMDYHFIPVDRLR